MALMVNPASRILSMIFPVFPAAVASGLIMVNVTFPDIGLENLFCAAKVIQNRCGFVVAAIGVSALV
jgi:hypothetical protein